MRACARARWAPFPALGGKPPAPNRARARRRRAPDGVPQPMMRTYYEQRASEGGLVISEATGVGPTADGYPCTPNLYARDALEGWKPIVEVTM